MYATYGLCVAMIIFSAITYRSDTQIAREMIVVAGSLLGIILTAYTAFATLDDKWHDH